MCLVLLAATILPLAAQDNLLRTLAFTESLAPFAYALSAGIDDEVEAGIVAGSLLLHTAPNVFLLYAEQAGEARATRTARLVSAAAGATTALIAGGLGVALIAGAFSSAPISGSGAQFVALSLSFGFLSSVDLLFRYSVETDP